VFFLGLQYTDTPFKRPTQVYILRLFSAIKPSNSGKIAALPHKGLDAEGSSGGTAVEVEDMVDAGAEVGGTAVKTEVGVGQGVGGIDVAVSPSMVKLPSSFF